MSCKLLDNTYFDVAEDRLLLPEDACTLEEWLSSAGQAKFAIHPKGFPIFLDPVRLNERDEYRNSDPYDVIGSNGEPIPFHAHRLQGTLLVLEHVLQSGPERPRILDIGCGAGVLTAAIRRRFSTAAVLAIDASLTAIISANEHFTGIDFAVGDAFALPYSPGYFDVVVCNNIWEHVTEPLRLLESVRRVLAPGGVIVISTPNRYRLSNISRVLRGKPVTFLSDHHVTEYTIGQVMELLHFGGFAPEVIDVPPLRTAGGGLLKFPTSFTKTIFRGYLNLLGSHYRLDWTIFYLARRKH
jgi:SAM-dependent methyltransferase